MLPSTLNLQFIQYSLFLNVKLPEDRLRNIGSFYLIFERVTSLPFPLGLFKSCLHLIIEV